MWNLSSLGVLITAHAWRDDGIPLVENQVAELQNVCNLQHWNRFTSSEKRANSNCISWSTILGAGSPKRGNICRRVTGPLSNVEGRKIMHGTRDFLPGSGKNVWLWSVFGDLATDKGRRTNNGGPHKLVFGVRVQALKNCVVLLGHGDCRKTDLRRDVGLSDPGLRCIYQTRVECPMKLSCQSWRQDALLGFFP